MESVRETFFKNRRDAMAISDKVGQANMRKVLQESEADLVERLRRLDSNMEGTFTEQRMMSTLEQIRNSLKALRPGMLSTIVDTGMNAASSAADGTIEYLQRADHAFRGIGVQPLALDEASMLTRARNGARSSILQRLAMGVPEHSGGKKPARETRQGVLDRYGSSVVGHFEDELRIGILTRKPWGEIRNGLIAKSPFLQGAPAHWAERIVRTETMQAYNRSGHEALEDAQDQLGDMVKILSATFDDRTCSDSYAVHGQIRKNQQPFDTWYGRVMHPPARPNDREIIVPHRIAWPIPAFLEPRGRGEVVARWHKEKRTGSPPPLPPNTTIDRKLFGKDDEED